MSHDYGVSGLHARRLVELLKEYRATLRRLEQDKKRDYPIPSGMTIEEEEVFLDSIIDNIDVKKAHIKSKMEKVCESALSKLGIVSNVTITENRYGRIRCLAECPSCHQQTDLVEAVDWLPDTHQIRIRCTECSAQKVVDIG